MMLSEVVVYLDEVGSLEPNAITVPPQQLKWIVLYSQLRHLKLGTK